MWKARNYIFQQNFFAEFVPLHNPPFSLTDRVSLTTSEEFKWKKAGLSADTNKRFYYTL